MIHSITLRHIYWFRVVAQEKSFRKAAEVLHTDQSGISRVIKELEERLGIELFARTQRTIRLTPAGEQLQAQSDDLLTSFEHMVRMMRDTDARAGIALRIGIADGLVQPRLSQRFAAWRATVPRTELEISEMRASNWPVPCGARSSTWVSLLALMKNPRSHRNPRGLTRWWCWCQQGMSSPHGRS